MYGSARRQLADVEDARDVLALEPHRGARLAEEALDRRRARRAASGSRNLIATLLVELEVARGDDDAHAALADEPRSTRYLPASVSPCRTGESTPQAGPNLRTHAIRRRLIRGHARPESPGISRVAPRATHAAVAVVAPRRVPTPRRARSCARSRARARGSSRAAPRSLMRAARCRSRARGEYDGRASARGVAGGVARLGEDQPRQRLARVGVAPLDQLQGLGGDGERPRRRARARG